MNVKENRRVKKKVKEKVKEKERVKEKGKVKGKGKVTECRTAMVRVSDFTGPVALLH